MNLKFKELKGEEEIKEIEGQLKQKESQVNELKSIYENFRRYEMSEKVDKRVRLLIMNMFEDKQDGWKKSLELQDKGPMKLEEFRKRQQKLES